VVPTPVTKGTQTEKNKPGEGRRIYLNHVTPGLNTSWRTIWTQERVGRDRDRRDKKTDHRPLAPTPNGRSTFGQRPRQHTPGYEGSWGGGGLRKEAETTSSEGSLTWKEGKKHPTRGLKKTVNRTSNLAAAN